jgi:hypothetical protein
LLSGTNAPQATQVLLPATYILAYHDVVIVAVSNSQDIR